MSTKTVHPAAVGTSALLAVDVLDVAAGLNKALESRLAWDPDRPQVDAYLIASAACYLYAQADLLTDVDRLNWLEREVGAGRVRLLINHTERGEGRSVRGAIDDAMSRGSANAAMERAEVRRRRQAP